MKYMRWGRENLRKLVNISLKSTPDLRLNT